MCIIRVVERKAKGVMEMSNYYHVCSSWDGKDLQSLYAQYGDEAYVMYADKWPDSGNLSQVHAHVIHLHPSIDDAQKYADQYGGMILTIDDNGLDITIDDYEYPHPVCKHEIPAENIQAEA